MAISKIGSNATGFGSDLTITDGDLLFATAAKGVCLGVTSNTDANTIDDYEEGTWTPNLTSGYSFDGTTAHYTKIGNTVHIYCNFYRDGFSTNSNTYIISGLPFAPEVSTRVNSNGLGHWSCYNGSTDRRHGMLNASNDGNVYLIQDGTKVHATYDDAVGSDNFGIAIKWFYYTS